jgi:hypothetical protein
MTMTDGISPKPPGRVRGRPFEKSRSGNLLGRRVGCRNKTTIAAAALLAGEAETLTRKAVELALIGDPWARCGCASNASCRSALPRDKARGLKARGTASGMITPSEAATIAAELAMPDLDLIKQDEQAVRDRRERFAAGRSGNLAGRPRDWWSTPLFGRSRPAISSGVCGWSKPTTPTPRMPQPARMAPARIGSTTHRRVFAAELLQMQQRVIIDSIDDCNLPAAKGVVIARSRRRRSNLDGPGSCPRLLRCSQ